MILTFTGDICITGSFEEKIKSNATIFSDEIADELLKSDFVVGNLEGPTTNINTIFNKSTPLKSPVKTINYLHKKNISVFNLANNHILDYGDLGLKDTLSEIKNEKCSYFGADVSKEKAITPLIIKKDSISIALFGIAKCNPTKINNGQLFNADEFSRLKKQVHIYKNKVDFIIVNFHGGEEYSLYPSPVKRKFLKKIAALKNVSCVIAHHSHTLQGYEKYKNTFIFYSLGNFIFDLQNHKPHKGTDHSALLKLHFTKQNFTFSFVPFIINKGKIDSVDFEKFAKKINQLSDFSNYKKKWQKEAYRILFRKENPKLVEFRDNKEYLQNKSFIKILLSKKFYSKVYAILKDNYMFSLYANALIFRIKKKFTS
ncbi:CapA family protein [uncultured Polaribacter sp.]|uniref:CapA family protein n=1 Tax=uncultured Polaribacter sp. TaxID=174711 RepID=UPI00262D3501|nr:CapA family protein [uncultured Polaribacter sp.]